MNPEFRLKNELLNVCFRKSGVLPPYLRFNCVPPRLNLICHAPDNLGFSCLRFLVELLEFDSLAVYRLPEFIVVVKAATIGVDSTERFDVFSGQRK